MQKTNNPYNKSLLNVGILTIVLGITLGVVTIIINLHKYVNNINKYSDENKYILEVEIAENDNNYTQYIDEQKSLNADKQNYQKELAEISKNSNDSEQKAKLEGKIADINIRLEELEQLKYSSLTEKNKLRKEYNEVIKTLDEKTKPKALIKCYLVGFAIILVTINCGAYFIHLAFRPDADDVILNQQMKINKEYEEKLLTLKNMNNNKELKTSNTSKAIAEMPKKKDSQASGNSKMNNSTNNINNKSTNKKNYHNNSKNYNHSNSPRKNKTNLNNSNKSNNSVKNNTAK